MKNLAKSMLLCLISVVAVDNIQVIRVDGQTVGELGFVRNYTARVANADPDKGNTHLLTTSSAEQTFCSPFQSSQFQANGFHRLKASPGSQIVAQYLENGHISAPVSPESIVGNIYWFGFEGTNNTKDSTTFGEAQSWKAGVGRGKFLGITPFDDGSCGRGDSALPCRSTIQLPNDITVGSIYTIYWLWDYSGKLGNNTGHIEFYTSCMDIDIG